MHPHGLGVYATQTNLEQVKYLGKYQDIHPTGPISAM